MSSLTKAFWFKSAANPAATPGYSIFSTPWAGYKTAVGALLRPQNSGFLGGGSLQTAGNQNDEWTEDEYFDTGTYKWANMGHMGSVYGIVTCKLDATTIGTIDSYGPSLVNIYVEVTGIAVIAGIKVVKMLAATKNASASSYYMEHQTNAFIRTGA